MAQRDEEEFPGITPQKRIAASLLGFGVTKTTVARMMGMPRGQLQSWMDDPEFQELTRAAEETHEHAVVSALLIGEQRAATRLMELIESRDEDVALKAAVTLLDRMGKRGRPVEKTEAKQLILTGDPAEMLKRALADPGVRARLSEVLEPATLPIYGESDVEVVEQGALPPSTDAAVVRDGAGPEGEDAAEEVLVPSEGPEAATYTRVVHNLPTEKDRGGE